jgi:N utilization substance protein B
MKGNRRKAREDALQILYQLDLNNQISVEMAIQHFESLYLKSETGLDPFTKRLVTGVSEKVNEIDLKIGEIASHWKPERMAAVDRNILRLGAYEILFCDDIPSTVTLNEMVEIAKEFGAENTPSFVNGLLDKLKEKFPNTQKAE